MSSFAIVSRKIENRFCEVAIASHVCDFKKAKTKIVINQSCKKNAKLADEKGEVSSKRPKMYFSVFFTPLAST